MKINFGLENFKTPPAGIALWGLGALVSVILAATVLPSSARADEAAAPAPSDATKITFKKTKLFVGKVKINAEVADNEPRRERGLMERTTLKDSEGMIFIFDVPHIQAFWMKDTLIPLSIGFFSESGKLFQVLDMDIVGPTDLQPKTYLSSKAALYALEEPLGWFKRKKVELGAQLKIPELHIPDR